jgi:hypothetical protein
LKSYFPADYCPQREKVLDLSRSVLTGNRHYARSRRHHGRHKAKVERKVSRDQLRRAASWMCTCHGDVAIDCSRCYADDLPTISETRTGGGLPKKRGELTIYDGFADDIAQLLRWYCERVKDLDHYESESFLREKFLSRATGHSVKTRHAFDHLFEEIEFYRRHGHTLRFQFIPLFILIEFPDVTGLDSAA